MTPRRLHLQLCLCLAFLAVSCPAFAETSLDFVKRMLSQDAQRNNLSARLDRFLDIPDMARRALDERYERMSELQQRAYIIAYRRYLERAVSRYVDAKRDRQIAYLGARRLGNGSDLVVTRITASGTEHDVQWIVRTTPDPLVLDIVYDGVVATEQQKKEFETMLRIHSDDLAEFLVELNRSTP